MSERKVLNKYYPPDFDPSKIPRLKREKNRQFTIRLMAPFNMRCKTCGEYIYRGKKFNARKEDVIGKVYLGIQIYRFYIKCTKCLAEITFLTDPESQDYQMEYGAIRNFESLRLAEKQAESEAKQKKDEEENNPMKILENRTRDSRREMAVLETLEDLKELNAANAHVDTAVLFKDDEELKRRVAEMEREEDEEEIRQMFGKSHNKQQRYLLAAEEILGEVEDDDESDEDNDEPRLKKSKIGEKKEEEEESHQIKFNEEIHTSNASISKAVQQLAARSSSQSSSSSSSSFTKSHMSLLVKKKPLNVRKEESAEKLMPPPPPPPPPPPSTSQVATPLAVNPLGSLASYGSDDDDDE